MEIHEFEYQCMNKIVFTHDLVKALKDAKAALKVKKAFVCTDPGLSKCANYANFKKAMEEADFPYVEYTESVPNPDDLSMDAAAQALIASDCDCSIGFGGGSSLDTAKVAAAVKTNGGKVRDYFGVYTLREKPIPIIAIPTTAGSGADITYFAAIIDSQKNTKAQIMDPGIASDISIIHPENLLGTPQRLVPAVGFDALTHAVEGYINAKASPITESMSLKAFELISQNLVRFYNDTNDLEAAGAMLLASSLSCMACTAIGAGDAHCIARSVGGRFSNIHHGTALSVVLPHVLDFNLEVRVKKLADLARVMNLDIEGKEEMEAAKMLILAVQQIRKDLNLPGSYQELGMTLDCLDELAEASKYKSEHGSSAGAPPRKATIEEYKELITAAYNGTEITY